MPGQCEFASSYALGLYVQYFPTSNPIQLHGLLYSDILAAKLCMTNSIEPLKVTKEFNGTVEFVRNEKSCIWKKV